MRLSLKWLDDCGISHTGARFTRHPCKEKRLWEVCHVESASDDCGDLPCYHPLHRLVVVHSYPVLALIQWKT